MLFDYFDTAKLLGVSPRTVQRMVKDGELVPVRVRGQVRFQPEDIRRYINEHTTKVEAE